MNVAGKVGDPMAEQLSLLRTILDRVPSMLAYWDTEQRCRFANAAYENWFGIPPSKLVGRTLEWLLGPIYPLNLPYIERALKGEEQHFEREIPNPAGGPPRYSEAHYLPHVVDGVVQGFVALVTDISPRRRLELELRQAKSLAQNVADEAQQTSRRLEGLLQAMAEGVVVHDSTGKIKETNAAAEKILGLSAEALSGRTSTDSQWRTVRENGRVFPGEEHPAMTVLRTGQPRYGVVMGVQGLDGTLTWISINAIPRLDASGAVGEVVVTFHDITALRNATLRASEQERLATVGTLAAGVGHEINNPLAYILGNLEFALDELRAIAGPSPSARLRELLAVLGEAREGAERIRKIVRGLRAFSREDVALRAVDIPTAIETVLSMAAHELRHKASVTVKVDPGNVPKVLADESRLTQVLVNLVVNAAQAFERPTPLSNHITLSAASQPPDRVLIAVSDNGPGVPAHLTRRIFDPFFTTKPVGVGTGLGLSVSRSIVAALGGELVLDSEEGRGATFSVILPAATEPKEETPPPSREGRAPRGRVLVIDDDLAVLNTLRRILGKEHDVVTVADPRHALATIGTEGPFDLVLCDLGMPYLSGQELFARVRDSHAELSERFVFITGDQMDPAAQSFLARVSNERMDKPFAVQNLLAIARRFVSAPGGDRRR